MTNRTPVEMTGSDFAWAAQLMQRRRERYARYSPVFWRPRRDVVDLHGQFLRMCSERAGAVALRTDHGFVISAPQQGSCFVDDFAVDEDSLWATEGKDLLLGAWRRARSAEQRKLRVVSARRDEPKRRMLIELGLVVTERWWVKELTPTGQAQPNGTVTLGDIQGVLVAAPPVYDPGGPVCVFGALDPMRAAIAADRAAAAGAVLAIVQREGGDAPVPEADPLLEAAGYHNPAEFYSGSPLGD
jgi:hypothetical protein